MSDNNLYLFIDESGNFDFSSSGTKHLVMSVVATVNPTEVAYKLARLKYELLRDGHDIPNFHATADKQLVRNRVFAELERLPVIEAHSFWLQKRNHMSVDQRCACCATHPFGRGLLRVRGRLLQAWRRAQKWGVQIRVPRRNSIGVRVKPL